VVVLTLVRIHLTALLALLALGACHGRTVRGLYDAVQVQYDQDENAYVEDDCRYLE